MRVLAAKRTFWVSYKTVLYRLVRTDCESPEVWSRFQTQHRNRYGGTLAERSAPEAFRGSEFTWNRSRAGEPVALSEHDFRPDRLSGLMRKALEGDHVSLGRGAEVVGIPLPEMTEWLRGWAA